MRAAIGAPRIASLICEILRGPFSRARPQRPHVPEPYVNALWPSRDLRLRGALLRRDGFSRPRDGDPPHPYDAWWMSVLRALAFSLFCSFVHNYLLVNKGGFMELVGD